MKLSHWIQIDKLKENKLFFFYYFPFSHKTSSNFNFNFKQLLIFLLSLALNTIPRTLYPFIKANTYKSVFFLFHTLTDNNINKKIKHYSCNRIDYIDKGVGSFFFLKNVLLDKNNTTRNDLYDLVINCFNEVYIFHDINSSDGSCNKFILKFPHINFTVNSFLIILFLFYTQNLHKTE